MKKPLSGVYSGSEAFISRVDDGSCNFTAQMQTFQWGREMVILLNTKDFACQTSFHGKSARTIDKSMILGYTML